MALLDDVLLYRRRQAVTVTLVLIFCAFVGRLVQLQFLYFDELGKKSEENSIRNIPKEPVRGYMFDRFGHLVVDNRPAFTVTVMPFEFDKKMIPSLARLLSLDPEFVVERIKKGESYSRFAPVKIARDIDFKILAQLEENREALTGVDVQVESKRAYSTPARASHILGYLKEVSEQQLKTFGPSYLPGDVAGSTGLEAEYQETLRGEKGSELSLVNVRGQIVGSLDGGKHDRPSVDGRNLILTMDIDLQAYAESLLTDRRGAIVAIDPQDGGILAMVSRPDYDLSQFSGVTPPELWRELNEDEGVPLYNRATLTRYPPGSTFKMIAAIAALENDVVRPSWTVTCGGAFRFGNKVFKDLHVHGSTDMLKAIQVSCNVYFYQLMLKVGLDKWSEIGKEFGFGQITGMDIAEESPGLLPSTTYMNKRYGANGWTRGFIVSLGIGQGELGVTPLQMACYAMALGNQGQYHQPHAVLATVDRDRPNSTDTLMTDTRTITLKPSTWSVVREGMRRVVMETGGTGGAAKITGIPSAGKTGTAQNPHGPDHAWFIGFAPFDHPVIAIAVLVENAGFGGAFAAPIAGKCMERYMRNLGLIKSPESPQPVAHAPLTGPAPTAQN
jgi:penicillin-binding protein 2